MPLPYIPYKLASATLTSPTSVIGVSNDQEPIAVPTPQHPGLEDNSDDQGIPFHQATDAQIYFPADDGGYVFARVLDGGKELQLRWSTLQGTNEPTSSQVVTKASSSRSFTAALNPRLESEPARSFLFPAPLLPGLGIFADLASGSLNILAVTTSGFLYRLTFSVPHLFHDTALNANWASEYRIQHLATADSSSSVAQTYAADAGLVLITCADGTIVKLSQSRSGRKGPYEGSWKEQVLRPTSFLSGVSRFFGRANASSDAESSPIYALSLDVFQGDTGSAFAFAASRDRKLRVWNLVSDSCVRIIDLPLQMDSSGPSEKQLIVAQDETSFDNTGGTETQAYFSTVSRPLVKIFAPGQEEAQGYALYVLVYIPASLPSGNFFALYGVELEENKSSSGGLGEVMLLWQKRCDVETRGRNVELRDVAFTPQGDDLSDGWAMWALWDSGSGPLLKYAKVGVDSANGDESVVSIKMTSQDLSQDDWRTVSSERVYQALHGPDFDAVLESTKELLDPAEIFAERVLEPGRFSQASLQLALSTYRDETVPDFRPSSNQFASLRAEIASAVASNCKLESDPRTGGALYEKLYSTKIREWMRFVGLVEQIETSARWPISLALAQASFTDSANSIARVPLVVTREGMALPVIEDEASIVERLQRKSTEMFNSARKTSAATVELVQHERNLLIQAADSHTCQDVLPMLGDTSATVAEVFTLLESAFDLASRFTAPELEAFAAGLQGLLVKPLTVSIKEALADVWDTNLAPIAGDDAADILTKVISEVGTNLDNTIIDMIILLSETAGLFGVAQFGCAIASTDVGSAFTADALIHTLSSRHRLAVTFTLLLSALAAHDLMSNLVSNEMSQIAACLSVFQALSAALQLARTDGTVQIAPNTGDAAETDSIVAKLNQMSVAGRKSREPHHFAAPTLVHQCIRDQLLAVSNDQDRATNNGFRSTPSMQIKSGVLWSLWSLGMTDARSSLEPDAEPLLPQVNARHTSLAFSILIEGYPLSAEALLSNFPGSAASDYVRGRALVQMHRLDEATVSFEKVISALGPTLRGANKHVEGLFELLPRNVMEVQGEQREAAYYRHVSTFFEPLEASEYVIKFCQASIDAVGTFADAEQGEENANAGSKEVWYKIFRCQLGLDDFEGAYGTIMTTPFEGVRRDCLRNLVSEMCEEGHIQPLLTFTFPGLQQEVERTLSFKARNSDPLSMPNYYSVLYSYHVFRGDLKSAGAVMYQHAERLSGVLRSGPSAYEGMDALEHFVTVAVERAQSYLASINALTMLKHEHAWFAHATTDTSIEDGASESIFDTDGGPKDSIASSAKRQSGGSTLTRYMPASAYSRKVKDIRVVSVDDVRREYTMGLARLDLVRRYPDLAYSTTVLRPSDAVLLFINSDQFDSAFSTAHTLGVDMTPIFAALTLKAVALSRSKAERDILRFGGSKEKMDLHPEIEALDNEDQDARDPETLYLTLSEKSANWEGPAATRAWKYIQYYLEMFDRDDTYYQVVLSKTASSGHAFTPIWLTKWFTLTDNQDVLLRIWIKNNLILESAQYAIEWLQESAAKAGSLTRLNSQCIAYHLIDTILLNLQPDSTAIVSSKREDAKKAKSRLEDEVKKHITALAARSKTLKRQAEQDSYRQEKRREAVSGHTSGGPPNGMLRAF